MSTDITLVGSNLTGSLKRVYNEQERAAIDIFKDRYMEATTPANRKTLAQLEIFPSLFNYWKSLGKVYSKRKIQKKSDVS